jgi:hypothetical protein
MVCTLLPSTFLKENHYAKEVLPVVFLMKCILTGVCAARPLLNGRARSILLQFLFTNHDINEQGCRQKNIEGGKIRVPNFLLEI